MDRALFINGKVVTLDPARPVAEAIYVERGRIRAVGETEELTVQFGRRGVPLVDWQGGFVTPGLVDNHLHLMARGMERSLPDLSHVKSKEALLERLRREASQTPEGQWIRGLHWDQNRWERSDLPTLAEMDAAVPSHPMLLTRTCHHVHLVNSAAFRAAQLAPDEPDPADGTFGRDERGAWNGQVYENASKPFYDALPPHTDTERRKWARTGAQEALSLGLTAVHTEDMRLAGEVSVLESIFRGLVEEGLPLRSHHLIYHPHLEELRERGWKTGQGDEWFRIGAIKLFADGSIGGRTALLSKPYADDPSTTGLAVHTPGELQQWVRRARGAGLTVAIHAIGDGGVERVIDALEAAPLRRWVSPPHRDRLIHGQVLRRDLVERLKRLPVAVDIQPRFVAGDFPWVMERLGPERLDCAYAWRTLVEAGLLCGGGSDAPIEPMNPLLGIHAAVTRRAPGEDHDGYLPQEKLTCAQALRLFTLGAAETAGEEAERGSISSGKWADFSVFDQDLLGQDPDRLLETRVIMTVVNGRIAYRSG
ncbi:amidohydrolase [Desmospora profundinema]|uniref:Amidohydrolase YtcJ n=1 Tax=Desmospora profundinema TaxID=1571184 RepID=A0ABU1IRH0_9BACL|nr:amidohydrolase [Desmospora profundinema]MDR6227390.1 putative amidohydrolase YtcJ [Desmospora profundinema]